MIEKIKKAFDVIKLQQKVNRLKNENKILKDTIKEEIYKDFMIDVNATTELSRLRGDNRRLRNQVRELKEIIKEGK